MNVQKCNQRTPQFPQLHFIDHFQRAAPILLALLLEREASSFELRVGFSGCRQFAILTLSIKTVLRGVQRALAAWLYYERVWRICPKSKRYAELIYAPTLRSRR